MKKLILILVVVLLVIGIPATAVLAKDNQTNGTPFDEIWAAIKDLQQQIANIQLIPGPQGPAGPTGPQGPAGTVNGDDIAKTVDSYGEWIITSSNLTIPSNVYGATKIPFDTAFLDGKLDGFDTQTHIFTTPVKGIYNITATICVKENGAGDRRLLTIASPVYVASVNMRALMDYNGWHSYYISWTGMLFKDVPVNIFLSQDSGEDIEIVPNPRSTNLQITKLFNIE